MATEDVQTNLRLPADLKDRLTASAAENNRSLSAEVTSRLVASYRAANESFQREMEAQVAAVLARADTLTLRVELIKSRMDNLFTRAHLISSETERLTNAAKTDEDFAKVQAGMAEYGKIQAEAAELRGQTEKLIVERDAELVRMHTLQEALERYRQQLETVLAGKPKP